MAEDQNTPKPAAITFKQVERAVSGNALEVWREIGRITGAGNLGLDAFGDRSIDITGLADGKLKQIERLLKPADEPKAETEADAKGKSKEK